MFLEYLRSYQEAFCIVRNLESQRTRSQPYAKVTMCYWRKLWTEEVMFSRGNVKGLGLKAYIQVTLYRFSTLYSGLYKYINAYMLVITISERWLWIFRRVRRGIGEDLKGGKGKGKCCNCIITSKKEREIYTHWFSCALFILMFILSSCGLFVLALSYLIVLFFRWLFSLDKQKECECKQEVEWWWSQRSE